MFSYLFVGSGLFSGVLAHKFIAQGKSCLVLDKRSHIGGNIYTENIDGFKRNMGLCKSIC